MVDFGGWDMPVEYSGVLEEHRAVREARRAVRRQPHGRDRDAAARRRWSWCSTSPSTTPRNCKLGQAQYSALLYGHGGFVDDILVHKVGDEHVFFLCVNASNQDKDYEHICAANNRHFDAMVENAGPRFAQLAIQGPRATERRAKTDRVPIWRPSSAITSSMASFGRPSAHRAHRLHRRRRLGDLRRTRTKPCACGNEILAAGREQRDYRRAAWARATRCAWKSAMPLYGHEIHASITPWEAGLDWIVKLEKGDFLGREALVKQKEQGITRKLIGFEVKGRGIARDGYEVFVNGGAAGWVTSGGPAPALNKNIGMCYLPLHLAVARPRHRNIGARPGSGGCHHPYSFL